MKLSNVSLACLLVLVVKADQQHEDKNLENDNSKVAGRRWQRDNQPADSQSIYSESTSNFASDAGNEERAKDERTLKDYLQFDGIQNFLINALKPKPIVDTASEAEKNAPNYGSGTQVLGDFVVKGSETISRALNTILEGPKKAAFKLSTEATKALNQLGAYISGL